MSDPATSFIRDETVDGFTRYSVWGIVLILILSGLYVCVRMMKKKKTEESKKN